MMTINSPEPYAIILLLSVLLGGCALAFRHNSIVIRVPATYDSIRELVNILSKIVATAHLADKDAFACRIALDEACVNIIEHAYPDTNKRGEIEVAMQASPGVCIIKLTDFGEPYDPANVPAPQIGAKLDEVRPGGLGLHLMHTMMDEVQYIVGPMGNSLVMVKRRST